MTDGAAFPEQFVGKVAVVTGSTQGIGEATARLLAARGAAGLVICGRSQDRGQALAAELTAAGCPTSFQRADLSRYEDLEPIVDRADSDFGQLDVLVNCAGVGPRGTIWDTDLETYEYIFNVNMRAPYFLTQSAVRLIKRGGRGGAICSIGSISGYGGQPYINAYSASKGALMSFTRNTAFQLLRHRIKVNVLNIGWAQTPNEHVVQTTAQGQPPDWVERANRELPFGRLVQPDEVARAVAFLTSDESGLMTGALVDFDQYVIGAFQEPPRPAPLEA